MKERPILFNAEMVRAVLDGRKTVTRRVIKDHTFAEVEEWHHQDALYCAGGSDNWWAPGHLDVGVGCPYGSPGDRLWVRETWSADHTEISYRAGGAKFVPNNRLTESLSLYDSQRGHWRPSIFMPRWASRILLEVVSVRVERVQEISEDGAKAEGIVERRFGKSYFAKYGLVETPSDELEQKPVWAFNRLWDSINAKRGFGWDKNPWVWVVEFKRINS